MTFFSRPYPTVIPTVSAIFAVLLAGKALAAQITVIDGDTVSQGGQRIRIANIDAPEIFHYKCDAEYRLGEVAKATLEQLLSSGDVEIHPGDPIDGRMTDIYGRELATITVDGRDVGKILIAEQLARPWTGHREPWCDR